MKKLFLLLPLLLSACGGGGFSQGDNSASYQTSNIKLAPVKVNLVFPDGSEGIRGEDGTYRVVFLVNGLGISTSPQVFDNLSPGKHSFTVNVPVGGRRFMTVIISKFDNGGKEYPLYYGDVSFDMSENETTEINVLMNLSFYKSGGNNYYPGFEEKELFGDLSEENTSLGVDGRYFADADYHSPEEYYNSEKVPIKGYTVYTPFVSYNGAPYSDWALQIVYTYVNEPIPESIYTFYSIFYDSGIPPVFSDQGTPFNLGGGFSWNLIPEEDHFKVPGVTFDYDAGFVLEECEISQLNGTWSDLQNCQQEGAEKEFKIRSIGKPSGEFYLFYKSGNVNGTGVYLPFHISLSAIPDTIRVPSEISYLIEHFHEVTYSGDRIEKDVGVKVDVPSTPEGNFTFNPTYENFTVPSGQYYVEVFSKSEIPTPIEPYNVPGWKKGVLLKLNFDEMMNHQKLSFVRALSPEGETSSTQLSLPVVSGTKQYALILSSGGNFHVIDVTENSTVSLKDVSIIGAKDQSGRYLFELAGKDSNEFKRCSIWFNSSSFDDYSPFDVENLFNPDILLPVYRYENLPPDKLFVKLPDVPSTFSVVVECRNEDGTYKVRKYFYNAPSSKYIEPAFDYPSNYTQTENLTFVDDPSGYIFANSTSSISSSDKVFIYSSMKENVEFDPEYVGNTYIIVHPLINHLYLMNYFGKKEDNLTIYVTNYKGGTYRKGVLSFQEAESEENVTMNPDKTADLTWNPDSFSQCDSKLELLTKVTPSPIDNDGEEVVNVDSVPETIYIYKLCPSNEGGILYYKKFRITEPAESSGSGSNGTLNTSTNIPNTSTPE